MSKKSSMEYEKFKKKKSCKISKERDRLVDLDVKKRATVL